MSTPNSPILLLNDKDAQLAVEKKLRANSLAAQVFKYPSGSPERWKAIRSIWYGVDPHAPENHIAAIQEAQRIRLTLDDQDYGLTKASRGKARGEEVNGHIRNALVAVMPETLKAWLVKYDPAYLDKHFNSGKKEQRKAWRRVYATFPEYRTTRKQGDW